MPYIQDSEQQQSSIINENSSIPSNHVTSHSIDPISSIRPQTASSPEEHAFSTLVLSSIKNENWNSIFEIISNLSQSPDIYCKILFRICQKQIGMYLSGLFSIKDDEILNLLLVCIL